MLPFGGEVEGYGFNVKMGEDGTISVGPSRGRDEEPRAPRDERRGPEDEVGPDGEE